MYADFHWMIKQTYEKINQLSFSPEEVCNWVNYFRTSYFWINYIFLLLREELNYLNFRVMMNELLIWFTDCAKNYHRLIGLKTTIDHTFDHFSFKSLTIKLALARYHKICSFKSFFKLSNSKDKINSSQ